jgi:hypothetical protein
MLSSTTEPARPRRPRSARLTSRTASLALALALLLTMLLVPRQARADGPFLLHEAMGSDGYQSQSLTVNPMDRFFIRFTFTFSENLDPASVTGNLYATDGAGVTLPWALEVSANTATLTAPGPLEPDAAFTFTARGGPDGIKSTSGATLPGDYVYPNTTNNVPFAVMGFVAVPINTMLMDGQILPRSMGTIGIWMNQPVRADTAARAVSVRKQNGDDAGWRIKQVWGHWIYLDTGFLPKADERYTIAVASGPDGLLNTLGEPLARDASITLHTLNQSYPFRYTVTTNWSRFGVLQTDVFGFSAEAGPLTLYAGTPVPVWVSLLLVDADQDQVIYSRVEVIRSDTEFDFTLPHDGHYRLVVQDNRLQTLEVVANELQMPTVTPALRLPEMAQYETHNDPFPFAPTLLNPAETEWVKIYLGDQTLAENDMGPDGQLLPVTIDPSNLPDDIYGVDLVGKAKAGPGYGVTGLWILVDREDAFPDVPKDHWAHRYVEVMHHWGIVNGRPEGYVPDAPVTRAEFAKMLALTLTLQDDPNTPNPFADIDGHWAAPYILALADAGLANGDVVDGQRYFRPEETITRAQAATMLGRALGVSDRPVSGAPFTDWDAVPDWARSSVATLAEMGWINGFPDGSFQPDGQLQRDQAAKILAKFFGM